MNRDHLSLGFDINEYNKMNVEESTIQFYVDLWVNRFGNNTLEVIDFLKDMYVKIYEPKNMNNEELLKWAEMDLKVYALEDATYKQDYNIVDKKWAYGTFKGHSDFPELEHLVVNEIDLELN